MDMCGAAPVRHIVTLNRPPPTPRFSGPAPEGRRDGGLLARLGGKRGRDDDNDGGNGPRGRSRSRSRGRDRHREGGEGGPPRSRRRLASAVGAPDAGVAAGTWEEVGVGGFMRYGDMRSWGLLVWEMLP